MSLPLRHFPLDIPFNHEILSWVFNLVSSALALSLVGRIKKYVMAEFQDFKKEYLILKYATLGCIVIVSAVGTHTYFEGAEMFAQALDALPKDVPILITQNTMDNLTTLIVLPFGLFLIILMAVGGLHKQGIGKILYKILLDKNFREQYRKNS